MVYKRFSHTSLAQDPDEIETFICKRARDNHIPTERETNTERAVIKMKKSMVQNKSNTPDDKWKELTRIALRLT